jgi:uncharacterized protein
MFRLLIPALLALAACGHGTSSAAVEAPPAGYDLPAPAGRVVDRAGILASVDRAAIAAKSEALERATAHQLVVVTIPSLGGHAIEDYANALGNYWGIGRRGINDGVLILVAPNERKVRIEVGKGLETVLTDPEAGRIIDKAMLPAFRSNHFASGIEAGVDGVIREIGPLPGDIS